MSPPFFSFTFQCFQPSEIFLQVNTPTRFLPKVNNLQLVAHPGTYVKSELFLSNLRILQNSSAWMVPILIFSVLIIQGTFER